MKTPVLSLLACLLAGLPATAQKSSEQVSMKIDVVAWGESISGLTLKSEGANKPVTAYAFRYSKPLNYSGPKILEISRTGEGAPQAAAPADADAQIPQLLADKRKDNPNLVALAMLPTDSKRVTVLLAPAASGTYIAYVIDDDPSRLPLGRLRIHNLSPHVLGFRFTNNRKAKVEVKQSVVIEPTKGEVIYELAYEKDNEWIEMENSLATVRDDEQVQLVVLKSDASYFTSSDGSRSGYLQTVVLRRSSKNLGVLAELTPAEKAALEEQNKAEEARMEKEATRGAPGKKPAKPAK